MSFLLGLIPAQYRVLAEILLTLALAAAIWGWIEHGKSVAHEAGLTQGRAEVQAKWDAAVKKQQADAIAEAARNAEETQRRLAAQQEAQRAHDEEIARAQADAAHAHAAADGLRRQLAAFTAAARRAASNPAAGSVGPATAAPVDLLADVLRESDERAGRLAEALDASHAAGLQCERQYDALTVTP